LCQQSASPALHARNQLSGFAAYPFYGVKLNTSYLSKNSISVAILEYSPQFHLSFRIVIFISSKPSWETLGNVDCNKDYNALTELVQSVNEETLLREAANPDLLPY